jgi:hypothetical protein
MGAKLGPDIMCLHGSSSPWWHTCVMNHCVWFCYWIPVRRSVLYNVACVRYATEQCVHLEQLYFIYVSARKYQWLFQGEPVPSRRIIC